MILNVYAVLSAFLSLLRFVLGFAIVGLALSARRHWRRRELTTERTSVVEERNYLLVLLGHLLLWLNLLSWPFLYLLLQSYVPEWPEVMCIYGVTQIGAGSLGISRFLPPLLLVLQVMKPLLVFASGAWFVLYLVNRRTSTGRLTGRVLVMHLLVGLLAIMDAMGEVAYLAIPKKEEFAEAGCCTATLEQDSDRTNPVFGVTGSESNVWLYGAFYAVNGGMVLALARGGWHARRPRRWWLTLLAVGATLSLTVSAVFLIEVAAPRLLHLPFHHCLYDLIPRAPESLVAVTLFVAACFSVGWAAVVAWLGITPETRLPVSEIIHSLLRFAMFGYVSSVLMVSLELLVA
jgi:hypothetical protein